MTDLSKSSIEQFFDLVNLSNSGNAADLTQDLVTLQQLTPLTEDTKNTSVKLVTIPNRKYTGEVTVKYDRLNLQGFEDNYGATTLIVEEEATLADVVTAFNSHYGSNLQLGVDIEDEVVFDPIEYIPVDITLTALDDSIAYLGSINISASLFTTPLSSIVPITTLNGLWWPGIPLPSIQGNFSSMTNAPSGVSYIHSVFAMGVVYCLPGNYNDTFSKRIYSINPSTGLWTRLTDAPFNLPTNRSGLAGYYNGKIYTFVNAQSTCMIYDIASDTWSTQNFADVIDLRRGGTWYADTFYLIAESGIKVYNATTNTWSDFIVGFPGGSIGLSGNYSVIIVYEGDLHLFSRDGTTTQQHWKINLGSKQWTQLVNSPRKWIYTNPVIYYDHIYFYGDASANAIASDVSATLHQYEPATDEWTLVATGSLPVQRNGLVAVNDALIAIGGRSSNFERNYVIKIT